MKHLYEKYRKLQVQLAQYQQQLQSLQSASGGQGHGGQQGIHVKPAREEAEVEAEALKRRVKQLEAKLEEGLGKNGGLVLQEELRASEVERQAYLEVYE